jgi:hypothetical protein
MIRDLFTRWIDIHAHYSDAGVLPRSLVLSHFSSDYWISFHMMGGADLFIQIVFLIHGFICICMAIGFYTKTMVFLNWVFLTSLHTRNVLLLHGGDLYHRMMFFWAIFLPLGEFYSVDNALWGDKKSKYSILYRQVFINKDRKRNQNNLVINVGTLAIVIQIWLIYCTSYMHKTGS